MPVRLRGFKFLNLQVTHSRCRNTSIGIWFDLGSRAIWIGGVGIRKSCRNVVTPVSSGGIKQLGRHQSGLMPMWSFPAILGRRIPAGSSRDFAQVGPDRPWVCQRYWLLNPDAADPTRKSGISADGSKYGSTLTNCRISDFSLYSCSNQTNACSVSPSPE